MSVWTSRNPHFAWQPEAGFRSSSAARGTYWPTDRHRRLMAVALMTVVGVVVVLQIRANRLAAAAQARHLQYFTLHPQKMNVGTVTLPAPGNSEHYSVELILPRNAAALNHAVASSDIREHVKLTVLQANHPTPLVTTSNRQNAAPSTASRRSDIKLCEFQPDTAGGITIDYQLDKGLRWPDQMRIGVINSAGPARQALRKLAIHAQPYTFGFSFLLTFSCLCLCWRQMNT